MATASKLILKQTEQERNRKAKDPLSLKMGLYSGQAFLWLIFLNLVNPDSFGKSGFGAGSHAAMRIDILNCRDEEAMRRLTSALLALFLALHVLRALWK